MRRSPGFAARAARAASRWGFTAMVTYARPRAPREQCVDRAIYRDGHIGAPARPAFDAFRPRADDRAERWRELGAGEFGKDLVHVEHDARPAALPGTGGPHPEIGRRVNVHDL